MTKSIDHDYASPTCPLVAYVFQGPARVAIRTRTNDQPRYVDTRPNVWTWYDGGTAMKIDWSGLKLNTQFIEIAKAFMVHMLAKYSPSTAYRAARMLHRVSESDICLKFPWAADEIISAFNSWSCSREYVVVFRTLYRWARDRGIIGFSNDIYLKIKDVKTERSAPYSRIFLSQSGLELDEEIRLLKRIEREVSSDDWVDAQFNMMLHLGFELGPRSIQFHSLEIAYFEVIETVEDERYYTLWLPMAKKVGQRRPERRPRKVTTRLGEKIEQHIFGHQRRFGSACEPLFVSLNGKRCRRERSAMPSSTSCSRQA